MTRRSPEEREVRTRARGIAAIRRLARYLRVPPGAIMNALQDLDLDDEARAWVAKLRAEYIASSKGMARLQQAHAERAGRGPVSDDDGGGPRSPFS